MQSYPGVGVASETPFALGDASSTLSGRALWRREAADAIKLGRQLIGTTSAFPRAGTTNVVVTTFIEAVVALHDVSGALGREASGTLWWAMNLTFHSQSVLRHLTRILADLGDFTDARRTFELYVQLILKARQSQEPDSELKLKGRATDDLPTEDEIRQQAKEDDDGQQRTGGKADGESDSDELFIGALLTGARLLARDLGDPEEAWRYIVLAGDVVNGRMARGMALAGSVVGEVEECRGIVRLAMGRSNT
jgi:hypothetical protein